MGGSTKKRLWISGALVLILLLASGAFFVLSTWGSVNRVSIDRPAGPGVAVAAEPDEETSDEAGEEPGESVTVPPSADGVDVFLLVGSDSRDELDDLDGFGEFDGDRADVVMVLIRPRDGSSAALLSLPRDLLVDNICSSGQHRLNDALQGCGDAMNGPTALTLTVDNALGLTVDHFALVDLAGFQEAVDAIGGYEICVENPVRDSKANLELPAGCTLASGEQTLAWMRSRRTQELTETGWRTLPGVNDLTRNERQRQFLIDMMGRLSDFSSPQDVASLAQTVAPFVTVDSSLSLIDAVGLGWTMRGLGDGSIETLEVPVADAITDSGASVLVATEDIAEIVSSFLSSAPPALSITG